MSTEIIFKKSTKSQVSNCLEVGKNLPGQVFVRDSKDVTGPVQAFNPTAWTSFIGAVKTNTFTA